MRILLAATGRSGVVAVFGIAERAGDAFHITRVYGYAGRLGGVHRKRHLGEDEEGYRTGIVTTPRHLPELLDRIAGGRLPDADSELGV